MKHKEIQIITSILVISLFLSIFVVLSVHKISTTEMRGSFPNFVITGKVIGGEISLENTTTELEALEAINKSEQIILEMLKNNLSTNYMDDTLIDAKRIFEQAKYAEILRGDVDSTNRKFNEAKVALNLLDWNEIYYGNVLWYTEEIKLRKQRAYIIFDKLAIEKINLKGNSKISKKTLQILENAEIAFYNDRYIEAEDLIEEFKLTVEIEKMESSRFLSVNEGAKNFFQKYWAYLIILLAGIGISFYFLEKLLRIKRAKKHLKKLRIEKAVVLQLIKNAQTERYKENKISGLVYNIRIKKYHERMKEIDLLIPSLEKKLHQKENPKIKKISDKRTKEHKKISKPKKINFL